MAIKSIGSERLTKEMGEDCRSSEEEVDLDVFDYVWTSKVKYTLFDFVVDLKGRPQRLLDVRLVSRMFAQGIWSYVLKRYFFCKTRLDQAKWSEVEPYLCSMRHLTNIDSTKLDQWPSLERLTFHQDFNQGVDDLPQRSHTFGSRVRVREPV